MNNIMVSVQKSLFIKLGLSGFPLLVLNDLFYVHDFCETKRNVDRTYLTIKRGVEFMKSST